ncbi:MAG: sulfotransferase [Chloroflexota bacterium]
MTAQVLNIVEKHRPFLGNLASLSDFSVSDGDEVDAEIVLSSPGVSLYCLDDATRRAIFVELPPDIDLASAPFVYQLQYDQALRLIAMPYDTFCEVAHRLPEAQNLILIFSCGRSGTTLLSHVLNRLDNTLSLSEPDVASQFIHMRPNDGSRDAELRELLDSTVRMLFKPNAFKTPTTYAIKFRSEATQAMDLYQAAFPQAKFLYLYRDAVGYIASFYRLFRSINAPETTPLDEHLASINPSERDNFTRLMTYLDPGTTQISIPQKATLAWLLKIEEYLAQAAREIPVLSVRYIDLNQQREQTLNAIFKYCDLPTDQVTQTLGAFEGDSQAGTLLAREKPTEGNTFRLTDAQIEEIRTILRQHPTVKVSDFIVPGTLTL